MSLIELYLTAKNSQVRSYLFSKQRLSCKSYSSTWKYFRWWDSSCGPLVTSIQLFKDAATQSGMGTDGPFNVSWLPYSADSCDLALSVVLCSMTNTSEKYKRTQQGNLLDNTPPLFRNIWRTPNWMPEHLLLPGLPTFFILPVKIRNQQLSSLESSQLLHKVTL